MSRRHVGLMDATTQPHARPRCRRLFALGVTPPFPRLRLPAQARRPRHRYGAEYTLTHVTRGSRHLHRYLPRIGLRRYAVAGAILVHYTGYERRAESIPLNDTLLRRVGHMLGTADIIAQMADRCYLEKCRDRLYPEFVLGGLTKKRLPGGRTQILFFGRRSGGQYAHST